MKTRPVPGVKSFVSALILVGFCGMSSAAYAQNPFITVSLLSSPTSTTSGGTVTFSGSVTNSGSNTQTVFINADTISLPPASPLTYDDTAFFNDTSFSLTPGQSFPTTGTTPFFTIKVASGTPTGNYSGTFNVQGGVDSNANALEASVPFTVRVVAAPEPSEFAALGMGILGLSGLIVRTRKKQAA